LYKAPVEDDLLWEEEQIVGMGRWLNRLWKLITSMASEKIDMVSLGKVEFESLDAPSRELWYKINETVQLVTDDMEKHRFNTAISHLISLTHELLSNDKNHSVILAYGFEYLIRMIAPLAPCIAEELWQIWNRGRNTGSVFDSFWPKADTFVLENGKQMQTVAIQVGGSSPFSISLMALRLMSLFFSL
jgi:leucyl-tRNA synthetase